MRCPRCGNENPEINRFCGMCGTTLLAAPAPPVQPRSAAPAPPEALPAASVTQRPQMVELPHREEHVSPPAPSFLGLNDAPPSSSSRSNLALDPHARPSGSLDYLLEDDETQRGGGGAKFVLILVALVLAAGLGYLRWKNQAFGWLSPSHSKPAATEPSNGADGSAPALNATQPAANAQPAPATPAPATDGSATGPPATTAPGGADSAPASAPGGSNATQAANPATTNPSDQPVAQPKSDPSTSDQPKPEQVKSDQAKNDLPKKEIAKPEAAAARTEAPKPVRAADTVAEAQKYLYGRGAAQDCDRGMRLLKPAANEANTKAMIEMGALYSAGLCAPRDLPTAYRWFALALRKDPSNQSVQADLQKLWGEMTQPERQLAIRLTQ